MKIAASAASSRSVCEVDLPAESATYTVSCRAGYAPASRSVATTIACILLLQACSSVNQAPRNSYAAEYSSAPAYYPTMPVATRFPLEPLRGVWQGTYYCSQGPQNLQLTIIDGSQGVEGFAEFSPPANNPRIASGAFSVRGSVNPYNGTLQVTTDQWIRQPTGYTGVTWEGVLQPDGSFSGRTLARGCSWFSLTRDNQVDPERFAMLERDPWLYARQYAGAGPQAEDSDQSAGPTAGQVAGVVAIGGILCWLAGCFSSSSSGSETAPSSSSTTTYEEYRQRVRRPDPEPEPARPDTSEGCSWGDTAYGTCH